MDYYLIYVANSISHHFAEDLKKADKEDKLLEHQWCREKRIKQKMKLKEGNVDEDNDQDISGL